MKFALDTFSGICPATDSRLLPGDTAQIAHNCILKSGKIIPLRKNTREKECSASTKTIFRQNGEWIELDYEADCVPTHRTFGWIFADARKIRWRKLFNSARFRAETLHSSGSSDSFRFQLGRFGPEQSEVPAYRYGARKLYQFHKSGEQSLENLL